MNYQSHKLLFSRLIFTVGLMTPLHYFFKKVTFAVTLSRFLQRWSSRGRPWPRGRPRLHILKSLALASKPQVLENCPILGSRTALFFEPLKFRWKTPETSRKICRHLFCFPQLEHRRRQGEGGRPSPQLKFHQ